MPNVQKHTPGSFCWIELGTPDQNAAKKFYGSLLGWTAEDSPMGPDEVYTIFKLNGEQIGGCYKLTSAMQSQGVPPNWMLYVAVASADQTATKVEAAGGTVMMAPFDVMDFGRMAVFQDPTGAVFSVWQPLKHHGFGVESEPGAFCWADLMTSDPAKAARFYESIFGWKLDPGKDNSGYLHIKNGERFMGGIPPAEHHKPGVPPHWLIYLQVKDCDASTTKAKEAGAQIFFGPMSMPEVGRWSIIADPQGAVSAVFQSAH